VADYGQQLSATVNSTLRINRAHLIKLGSATHSENQDQRLVPLAFTQTASSLSLTMPSSRDVAPPGHYLLFVVDQAGVPSVGAMIKVGQPLVEPGQLVATTLEANAWDSFLVPTTGGSLAVSVTADAPVKIYVSDAGPVVSASAEAAQCIGDLPGSLTQTCLVDSVAMSNWYVTVHGAERTDYSLNLQIGNSTTPMPPATAQPEVAVQSPDEAPLAPGDGVPIDGVSQPGSPADDGENQGLVRTGGAISLAWVLFGLIILCTRFQSESTR